MRLTYLVEIDIALDLTKSDRKWFGKEIAVRVKEACDDSRYDGKKPRSKVKVKESRR